MGVLYAVSISTVLNGEWYSRRSFVLAKVQRDNCAECINFPDHSIGRNLINIVIVSLNYC